MKRIIDCEKAKRTVFIDVQESNRLEYLIPKKSSLRHRLPMGDQGFIDFVAHLLEVNPKKRPSASEALKHPWLSYPYEPISSWSTHGDNVNTTLEKGTTFASMLLFIIKILKMIWKELCTFTFLHNELRSFLFCGLFLSFPSPLQVVNHGQGCNFRTTCDVMFRLLVCLFWCVMEREVLEIFWLYMMWDNSF